MLASVSDALVVAFNSPLAPQMAEAGRLAGVDMREYSVVYDVLEEVRSRLVGGFTFALTLPAERLRPYATAAAVTPALCMIGRGANGGPHPAAAE